AGDDWKAAWSGEISVRLDGVDDALNRYYYRQKYGLWTVRAKLPDRNAFAQSIAPVADVLALRAVLQAHAPNPDRAASRVADAQPDLDAAYALDPGNARVQKIRAAANAAPSDDG